MTIPVSKRSAFAVLGACLWLSAANAEEEPTRGLEPGGYDWARTPSADDIARFAPAAAKEGGVSGRVLLSCRVIDGGELSGCKVAAETPEGMGFGEWALKASKTFRMKPVGSGPAVWGGPVRIPLVLNTARAPVPVDKTSPGEPSMLITVLKPGIKNGPAIFECPSKSAPARRCQGHKLDWVSRPSIDKIAPMIRKAGGGVSAMECSIDEQGVLGRCKVSNDGAALTEADFLELAGQFKAPPATTDRTPTAGKRVLVNFDWKLMAQILAVYEAT